MRYEPTPSELAAFDSMDAEERLHYFITRCMECEEVWRLRDTHGWKISSQGEVNIMAIWPYRCLAEASAENGDTAQGMSLEHFVDHELNRLYADDIVLEIFPGKQAGMRLTAQELHSIFERKLDEEQYFIEG